MKLHKTQHRATIQTLWRNGSTGEIAPFPRLFARGESPHRLAFQRHNIRLCRVSADKNLICGAREQLYRVHWHLTSDRYAGNHARSKSKNKEKNNDN
jgi:hypothetical protein